jgi:hypothetical protein
MDVSQIYPISEENPDGYLDETTSNTLNSLVKAPQAGTGPELYETLNAYHNYKNEFALTSTESEAMYFKDPSLTYVSSDGETITTTDFNQYTRYADAIQYNSDFSKYFKLTLSGIHYSKYFYLTKAMSNVKMLRSFVTSANDLLHYNMTYDSSKTIYFDKILLTSNTDKSGENCHQQLSILSFNKNGSNYNS